MRRRLGQACAAAVLASQLAAATVAAAPIRTTSAATGIFQSNIAVGRLVVADASRPDLRVSTLRVPAALVYGPTTNTLVGLTVPYVTRRVELGGQEDTVRGLGDIELFGQYRFWQQLARGRRDMASARLVVDLPTGSTSRGLDFEAPEALRRAVQPGSGSADVTMLLALSREDYRYNVDLNVGATINTEGDGLDRGEVFFARSSTGVFVLPSKTRANDFEFGVQLETELRHADRGELDGLPIASSGGTTFTAAPGLQLIIGDRVLIEASAQFLVAEKLNGAQPTLDHNVLVGIRVAL